MSVTNIKTRLISQILKETDADKLDHIEYVVNIDAIRTRVKDLFSEKNVPVYGYTFEHTVNNLIAEVKVDLNTKIQMLDHIKSGQAFESTKFLSDAAKAPVQIQNYMKVNLDIDRVMNFIADDWSCSAVGKGEFFFTLFLEGATKPNGPGDLNLKEDKLELKGKWARLCSSTTHACPASIKKEVHIALEQISGRQFSTLPVFGKQNVEKFYNHCFTTKEQYVKFIKYTFNKLAYKASPDDFNFVDDCVSNDAVLNWEPWKFKQAQFEYSYYKKHEHHDYILFINPEKKKALLTKDVNDIINNYDNFSIQAGYNWNNEKNKVMQWTLK